MGDAFLCIGPDQRFVKSCFFLVVHVRDQQAEEDGELLDLSGQYGVLVD